MAQYRSLCLQAANEQFTTFLRKLSKKGFYAVLLYISEKGELNYNQVLKAAQTSKVAESSSQISAVLNTLTKYGLLERTAFTDQRPVRITYKVSKRGKTIINHLRQIESEVDVNS